MTSNVLHISTTSNCPQSITADLLGRALAKVGVDWYDAHILLHSAEDLLAQTAVDEIIQLARRDPAAMQAMRDRCSIAAVETWISAVAQFVFCAVGYGADYLLIKAMARDAFADINGRREGGGCFPPPEFIAHVVAAEYAARRMFA